MGHNPLRAFSSEVDTGSREENTTKQEDRAVPDLISLAIKTGRKRQT
jgi:hypothetical protein